MKDRVQSVDQGLLPPFCQKNFLNPFLLFWVKIPLSQNIQKGDNLYYQMNHAHPSLPNSMHEYYIGGIILNCKQTSNIYVF